MSIDKNLITESIKENRPKLSNSSIKTYVSLLYNLAKRLNLSDINDLNTKEKDIIKDIEDMKSTQSQKTLLSGLFIITKNEKYKSKMMVFIKETNDKYKTQKVSEKRKDSYVTKEQIQTVYEQTQLKLKKVPNIDNYVNFLIVGLMSGIFIPPRRLEYASVKIRNYNKDTDNFLDMKKKIIGFNKYKTVNTHGFQSIDIPKEIIPTLKKFLKLNETDYLLIKNNGKPLNASDLSKRIGSIFGDDAIGVDVLRSVYISHLYKDVPALNKLEDVANKMGHSVSSAMNFYNKLDIKGKKIDVV